MASLLTSPSQFGFSSDDLDRMVAMTFVERIEFHQRSVPRTTERWNWRASRRIRFRCWCWPSCQTAGRGRGANRWWTESGCADVFSVVACRGIVSVAPAPLAPGRLTVGLAVTEAIEDLVGGPSRYKSSGRTTSTCGAARSVGSWSRYRGSRPGQLVIGIGLNVNNDLSAAPADVRASAIAFCEVLGSVSAVVRWS